MQNKPLVSFILPNYNNEHVLDMLFSSFLENNTYENYEFLVTDDGSLDNSLSILRKWEASGKITRMKVFAEKHHGIVHALNTCLFAAKGDFIIRMDGDATVETKGFVEKFLEFYSICPEKIGVITGKVTSDMGPYPSIAGSIITETGFTMRGCVTWEPVGKRTGDTSAPSDEMIRLLADIPSEVDTAAGICTFSDRETAMKIGGFDVNYPLWVEDIDFYLSYRLHNKKCFYLPEIESCHRISLRGSRNAAAWKKHSQSFWKKISRALFYTSGVNYWRYKFLGLPVLTIKQKNDNQNTYYLFRIPVYEKRVLSYKEITLQHDFAYMSQKWGFDCLNPNMAEVLEKYKGTEVVWAYDENLRKIGEDILAEYEKIRHAS